MLKIWNHSTLSLVHSLSMSSEVSVFSLKYNIFVSGSSTGQLRIVELREIENSSLPHEDSEIKSNGEQDNNNNENNTNTEHTGAIIDVDVLEVRNSFNFH